ncbi:hypothetical protein NDN08_001177 [Rhodosorus marinus]|uniref:Nudix hydrolase domain-containing protein n=1 Tax=Rhodosorus marinus TaxID=101924 RepID=A0AAV8URK1_9RHOD|nr:hypothetical protein NDN08_001177 [Rhodosorus marinus]
MIGIGDGAEEGRAPILEEVLDDLCCRFLLNLPKSEFSSFERLFFAIESAHWFYDDFFRENHPNLPKFSLKDFAFALFAHTPLLQPYRDSVDQLFKDFRTYKQGVPKCGAAMLNKGMDRVVLVLGWGSKGRWGFPKGKLGNDETELEASIREVDEETGYNFAPKARENDSMELIQQGVRTIIFVVKDVPEDTPFEPKTRKEIAKIEWHKISDLPDDYSDKGANKFASLIPFVKRLKRWIRNHGSQNRMDDDGRNKQGTDTRRAAGRKKGNRDEMPLQIDSRASGGRKLRPKTPRKDQLTFGTPDRSLNDYDREKLFTKYVEESERRRRDLDTREYDLIVDEITYGNSGAEEIARRLEMGTNDNAREMEKIQNVGFSSASAVSSETLVIPGDFSFKVPDILQCFS